MTLPEHRQAMLEALLRMQTTSDALAKAFTAANLDAYEDAAQLAQRSFTALVWAGRKAK